MTKKRKKFADNSPGLKDLNDTNIEISISQALSKVRGLQIKCQGIKAQEGPIIELIFDLIQTIKSDPEIVTELESILMKRL